MNLNELLKYMVSQRASDIHLKPMRPPLLRLEGRLTPMQAPPLSPESVEKMLLEALNARQKKHLEEHLYVDFAYSIAGISRFRATIFFQRGTLSAVFRRIPFNFPSIDDWGLPEVLYEFCKLPQGLILVTGPTGAGKSSTLAAMILEISEKRPVHIVTIEDPIEFLFKDAVGSITQREIGEDTHSFHQALRNTLRQDPDVIMVGEMRDPETIMTAMTAAETGHLVLSTLHTNSASQTIDRIIDSFPEGQHRQIRIQLSQVLKGIVSLTLLPRCDEPGLIAAVEILRDNPKVHKLILEGNISEINEEMEKSVSYFKMQTMNQALLALIINGAITKETGISVSAFPTELDSELRKLLYGQKPKTRETADGLIEEYYEAPQATASGEDMAEQLSNFSKITELQEIRKLYEESREKHLRELGEKDEAIHHMDEDLRMKSQEIADLRTQAQMLMQEREKLKQQLAFTKNELESKILRLQERIQQLTSTPVPAAVDKNKGFFRK